MNKLFFYAGSFRTSLLTISFFVLALAASSPAGIAVAQDGPAGLTRGAADQIKAIMADKAKWSDTQKKINPSLIYASRVAKGLSAVPGSNQPLSPEMQAQNVIDGAGNALVDITTTDAPGLVGQIHAAGGSIVSSLPQFNAVRAKVPLGKLEGIAASASVKIIQPAEVPITNRVLVPSLQPLKDRGDAVGVHLSKALGGTAYPGLQTNAGFGAVISEAVVAHGANIVQNTGVTGAGVKACVISDGISSIAARQASGELPSVQILATGQGSSSGDEGTAMLELVADMAPGASLGFSTARGGKAQFAQNILDLKNVMGCNIIVDDISYFSESAFQEDIVANAVTTVVNAGAMYFSSSANSGHLTGGQSGTWEGDFVDGGPVSGAIAAVEPGNFHSFGGALFDTLTSATSTGISLKWSDPIGASLNDYDLFITDNTGTNVIGSSLSVQSGSQDPFEFAGGSFPAGSRIYVVRFSGAARALRVDTNRGRLSIGTNGSTYGHNGGEKTISVGAISSGFLPISGRRLNSSDATSTYSSDGPRKLFLNPVPATTYITPGCFTFGCAGGGGKLLSKVDIAAADCDTTTTPGFTVFCGTSAAAPQAAAIAALVKSSAPSLTGLQIISRMKSTAIDIMALGVDADSGSGIPMADSSVQTRTTYPHDLNGDSVGDVLWRNTGTGDAVVSLVSNGKVISSSVVASLPLTWGLIGTGDFNGDGKSDVLWRDTSGNTVASLFADNGSITSSGFIANLPAPWAVAGIGDFNGNGHSDILWRNSSTGDYVVSLLVGGSISSSTYLVNLTSPWIVAGVGDFNNDSRADVLWQNTSTGSVVVSLMGPVGTSFLSSNLVATLTWSIAGIGDFNGDGRKDILWRSPAGDAVVSLLASNGASITNSQLLTTLGSPWALALVGDFDGNGRSDILWRNSSTGATVVSLIGATALPTISSSSLMATVPLAFVLQGTNQN